MHLLAQAQGEADLVGQYTMVVALTVVVVVVLLAALWLGWRNRKRRQHDIGAPHIVPTQLLDMEPRAAGEGMYVTTVRGRDWLDRIAVYELGLRTAARLEVHRTGVVVLREGSSNLYVPTGDLTDVRLESGMNGKFVEKQGLIVFSWLLGGQEVSTGFRTRSAAAKRPLYETLSDLLPTTHMTTDADSGRENHA